MNYNEHGFRWLPTRISDRLEVLAKEDAASYDSHILKVASHPSTAHLVTREQVEAIRIWPIQHQFAHNYAFTKSCFIPTIPRDNGIGNHDAFGIFCCVDCYDEAQALEETLENGGNSGAYDDKDKGYLKLLDHQETIRRCIAFRKEKDVIMTERSFDKLGWCDEELKEEQAEMPAAATATVKDEDEKEDNGATLVDADEAESLSIAVKNRAKPSQYPVKQTASSRQIAGKTAATKMDQNERKQGVAEADSSDDDAPTTTQAAPRGMIYEKGFGCKECPKAYFDRLNAKAEAMKKRSLQFHVETNHPGRTIAELRTRRDDFKLRKDRVIKSSKSSAARGTTTKEPIAVNEGGIGSMDEREEDNVRKSQSRKRKRAEDDDSDFVDDDEPLPPQKKRKSTLAARRAPGNVKKQVQSSLEDPMDVDDGPESGNIAAATSSTLVDGVVVQRKRKRADDDEVIMTVDCESDEPLARKCQRKSRMQQSDNDAVAAAEGPSEGATESTRVFRDEVMNLTTFTTYENLLLDGGTGSDLGVARGLRLELIDHAGHPSLRAAAFGSGQRRLFAEDRWSGYWEKGEEGRDIRRFST